MEFNEETWDFLSGRWKHTMLPPVDHRIAAGLEADKHAEWMRQQQRERDAGRRHTAAKPIEYNDQRCAWHEAAHITLSYIQRVAAIRASIDPRNDDNLAYVMTTPNATDLQTLLFTVGGREGEIMGLGDAGAGDEGDMRTAREIATRLADNDAQAEEMLRGYRCAARKLLTKHRHLVEALVQALLKRRTLEWGEIDAVIDAAVAGHRAERKRRWLARRNARRSSASTGTRSHTAANAPASMRALFEHTHYRSDGRVL